MYSRLTTLCGVVLLAGCQGLVSTPPKEARCNPAVDLCVEVDIDASGTGFAPFKVRVREVVNPNVNSGKNVLMIHGFASTGGFWLPLANAIINAPRFDAGANRVHRIFILDLPAHGDSGWPRDTFGINEFYDYIAAIIDVIDALPVDVVMGHSMGGLLAQAVQEALLGNNSSLAERGVSGVALLAPSIPEALDADPANDLRWNWVDKAFCGAGTNTKCGSLLEFVPTLGWASTDLSLVSTLDDDLFRKIVFGTWGPDGQISPDAPTSEEIAAMGGAEPLIASFQLLGQIGDFNTRVEVREGAFSRGRGTRLATVSFQNDYFYEGPLFPGDTGDHERLHTHLRGQPEPEHYFLITEDPSMAFPNAIHHTPWLRPATIFDGLSCALGDSCNGS